LTTVTITLGVLLALQYLLPYLLERCQYAITRGQQRAQHELAADSLKDLQLTGLSEAYQMVSQHVGPSVVHISVVSVQQQPVPAEFAHLFGRQRRETRGQGSGVVVDPSGYIVTNYHVVVGATEIQVSLSDGRVLPAQIVGGDALTDLAVLKVPADNLVAAKWGDSERLQVGAMVWAVGSPFGLERTITFGILSAKHRSGVAGEVYQDFMQTDAAVNPGNSGGPLVDARGRVVGINTAILGESYRGVSFAIPSSIARPVYDRLRASGQVARGWLGVNLDEITDEDVRRLRLPDKRGALISGVLNDPRAPRPAMDAGMQPGDVVIRWNGVEVAGPAELIRMVAMTDIGSQATVVVRRDGRELALRVQIAERPRLQNS
jgi:S1-C subfamily serine protease